jgi:hypothetical protein
VHFKRFTETDCAGQDTEEECEEENEGEDKLKTELKTRKRM